jgi:hypothetical protein
MRLPIDHHRWSRRQILALAATGCLARFDAILPSSIAAEPSAAKERPKWAAVEQLVRKHFAEQKDYQPGDLITRSQAKPVFKKLGDLGWMPSDQEAIVAALTPDGDFIVKELRTPQGRKFMRSIASYPDAFDRLDKLSRLPEGQSSIRTLVKGPGGYKLLDYLTSQAGRPQTADFLAESPQGHDFDRPTGRIYTLEAFVKRLQQSYSGQAPAAKGAGPKAQAPPRQAPRRSGY